MKSQFTDAQVVATHGAMPPTILLRQERMKLFISIVVRRHWPALLLLIAGKSSPRPWLRASERDYYWLDENGTLKVWVKRIGNDSNGV